jgi:hypothetical protein
MNEQVINSERFYIIKQNFQQLIKGSEFDHHVYFVGGCVRDDLLRRNIKDIDIVVDLPDGGKRFAYYLKDMGILQDDTVVEFPIYGTYRFFKVYKDFNGETFYAEFECSQTRKLNLEYILDKTAIDNFGTIYEDAKCRDLTINAIYYDVTDHCDVSPLGECVFSALKAKLLKCTNKPDIIFNDDPLRVFRIVRFLATLNNFEVGQQEYNCIKEHNYSISEVAWERINKEMDLICMSGKHNNSDIIELLHYIFSENCDNIPAFLHNAPKYEYTNCIRSWPETVPQYMLNTLYKDGYNPEYIDVIKRMRFSYRNYCLIHDIYTLVSSLLNIYKNNDINDNKHREYFRLLKEYAYNSKSVDDNIWKAITVACSYFNTIIKSESRQENGFLPRGFCVNNCVIPNYEIKDFIGYRLPITGDMIKEKLGIPEGPEIKQVMDFCFNEVISGNILNNDITSMLRLAKLQFGSTQN